MDMICRHRHTSDVLYHGHGLVSRRSRSNRHLRRVPARMTKKTSDHRAPVPEEWRQTRGGVRNGGGSERRKIIAVNQSDACGQAASRGVPIWCIMQPISLEISRLCHVMACWPSATVHHDGFPVLTVRKWRCYMPLVLLPGATIDLRVATPSCHPPCLPSRC